MKFFHLIWSGLWRKPVQTVITLLSISVTFFLFGMLHGVTSGFQQIVDAQAQDVLSVRPRFHRTLPISYLQRIRDMPGIVAAAPVVRMNGTFQKFGNNVAIMMTDPASYHAAQYVVDVSQTHVVALAEHRTAALVTPAAAARFGWKIGDRVPLNTQVFTKDRGNAWTFEIVGFFALPMEPELRGVWGQYDYLDAARARDVGTVNEIVARITDPEASTRAARAIDELYANSAYPTRTLTQREQIEAFVSQIGDVSLLINAVVGAAFFTLLSLTGHVTMQGVRERISEFAVMRAFGFSNTIVFVLILAELALQSFAAAAAGLAAAWALYDKVIPLPVQQLPTSVIVQGTLAAAGLALVSAIGPVWRLRRLQIATGLAAH